jgi:hypothetical protein
MTARSIGWLVRLGLSAVALLAGAGALRAESTTPVDLELVLAVDASGSVDAREFDLQTHGLAAAFREPDVIAAIEAYAPAGLAVALVQWSGRHQETVVVDWTRLDDAASAIAFARKIEASGRWLLGETAIADALEFSIGLLEHNQFAGTRRVIDISGDGPTNSGRVPDPVRDGAVAAGITINGLAIVNEVPILEAYYAQHVIGGPDAFVLSARTYDDFARALRLKLLREIEGAPLSDLGIFGPVLARRPRARRPARSRTARESVTCPFAGLRPGRLEGKIAVNQGRQALPYAATGDARGG